MADGWALYERLADVLQCRLLFVEKVRFFSVVASTQGLTIRIYRATRGAGTGSGFSLTMDDQPTYPLIFEHRELDKISKGPSS
jgi:hypothetical protein